MSETQCECPARERWMGIAKFPDYEVSDYGNVRKIDGTVLHPFCNVRGGYLRVSLYANGIHKTVRVHRLVLEAFVGKSPTGKNHGAHCNGDSADNKLSNLKWKTPKENEDDKIGHGRKLFGQRVGTAKITDADAALLVASATFTKRKDGLALTNGKQLAIRFRISYNAARAIIWGRGYPSVARPHMEGKKAYV